MANNRIDCSLAASTATPDIINYIRDNKLIQSSDELFDGVTEIILRVYPYLATTAGDYTNISPETNFGQFIHNIGKAVSDVTKAVHKTSKKGESTLDLVSKVKPEDISIVLAGYLANHLDLANSSIETTVTPTKEVKLPEDTGNSIVDPLTGTESEITLSEHFVSLGAKRAALPSQKLQLNEVVGLYFTGFTGYFSDFETYFKEKFSQRLVDNKFHGSTVPMGLSDDVDFIMSALKDEFKTMSKDKSIGDLTVKSVVENSAAAKEIYFANVAYNEFDSFVRSWLPGVDIDEKGYSYNGDSNNRTGIGADGTFSGFDQKSQALRLHLEMTPRLISDGGAGFVKDTKSPFLSTQEIKQISDTLSGLPSTLSGLQKGLKRLGNGKSPNAPAYRSLYNKFFAKESYLVDSVEHWSYSKIIDFNKNNGRPYEKLDEILSAIITDLGSNQVVQHTIVNNDKVIVSESRDIATEGELKDSLDMSVTHFDDITRLTTELENKVQVVLTEDSFNIKFAGYTFSYDNVDQSNTSGIPVSISEETRKQIGATTTLYQIMKKLGMPSYFTKDLITSYQENYTNFSSTSSKDEDLDFSNFVGNLIYTIALNQEEGLARLTKKEVNLQENKDLIEDGLPFPLLDTLHGFKPALTHTVKVNTGSEAKVKQVNINGDLVSTVSPANRLLDSANEIRRIRSSKTATAFDNNILVNGSDGNGTPEYSFVKFSYKDGITKGLISKSNSKLSDKEQIQYLIEHGYLGVAADNKYKKALIQTAVMSDRTRVDQGLFQASEGQSFVSNDVESMHELFFKSQKNQQNSVSNTIVSSWVKQLNEWNKNKSGSFDDADIKGIEDLNSLQEFLTKYKIPNKKVRQSTLLTENLMYVKDNDTVKIKDVILEMDRVWNNDELASAYIDSMLEKFKSDLRVIGYTSEKLSAKSLNTLKDKFSHNDVPKLYDSLITSYFYQSNTLSNSLMDIIMGSKFQFKGDINVDNTLNSAEFIDQSGHLSTDVKTKLATEVEVALAFNSMYGDQSKRNANLGSGHQHPRLAVKGEKGEYLGDHSKVALVEDPELQIELLGSLGTDTDQEIFDAIQFAHPLYELRLNKSLGGHISGFTTQGGMIKDISNEVNYRTGVHKQQKKATMGVFSYELMRKGSKTLHTLLHQMNTAVTFKGKPVIFEGNKLGVKNLQELWEHFGAEEVDGSDGEPSSWDMVLKVLGENPHIRESYVEKVGFKSGEKTGSSGFNTKDIFQGSEKIKYTEFSNKHHGVILQLDHNPDTTIAGAMNTKEGDNMVTLMTQVVSAVAFEGNSAIEADQINNALLTLSNEGLHQIESSIYSRSVEILKNQIEDTPLENEEEHRTLLSLLENPIHTEEEKKVVDGYISSYNSNKLAEKEYANKLVADAVAQREDYGSVTELLNTEGETTFNSKLLHSTLHSTILSEFSKVTTRVKFKGGQFVVGSTFGFVQTYRSPDGRVMQRDEVMDSPLIPFETVTNLNDYTNTDLVEVDGISMTVRRAKKLEDIDSKLDNNEVKGKKLPKTTELKWLTYIDNSGKPITKYIEEIKKDYIKNNSGEEIDSKHLTNKVQEILNNEDLGWKATDSEFFMPLVHQEAYNLEDGVTLHTIAGSNDINSVEAAEAMRTYFHDRITKNSSKYGLDKYRAVRSVNMKQLAGRYKFARLELLRAETNTYESTLLANRVSMLNKLVVKYAGSDESLELEEEDVSKINAQLAGQKTIIIESLAKLQAKEFPKTLEMIASRIPGQGKQSYTPGKIVGFVSSQRNTILGPVEMLTITGADHDGDKSSVILKSVDTNGMVYKYDDYIDPETGYISNIVYNEYIKRKRQEFVKGMSRVDGVDVKKELAKFDSLEADKLREATKNYVLDKLLVSARDPKNGVEAATGVSIEKVKQLVSETQQYMIDGDKVKFTNPHLYSPHNPISVPLLEGVNNTGGSAIGIFATSLKAFSAMTTAWSKGLKTDSKYIQFNNESINLFAGNPGLNTLYTNLFPEGGKGLHLYNERGRKTVTTIANTTKLLPENVELVSKLKVEVKELSLSPEQEAEYLLSKEEFSDLLKESQAWDSLSALLSAATDNAKELILAKIGASSSTSGLIATGVILGFELSDMITLMKDPEVKAVLETVKDATDFTNRVQTRTSLEATIKAYMTERFGVDNSKLKDEIAKNTVTVERNDIVNTVSSEAKIEKTRDVKKVMGITNTDDSIVLGMNKYNQGTEKFGSKTKTIAHKTPSTSDLEKLKGIVDSIDGIDYDKIDKTEVISMIKLVVSSSHIIIDQGVSEDFDFHYNLAKLAGKYGKPIYRINNKGQVYSNGIRIEHPILMTKTFAYLSNQSLVKDDVVLDTINKITLESKEILKKPSLYNKYIENAIEERNTNSEELKIASDDLMYSFLNNGPRQLLKVHSIASELRLVTGLLSINGGLKNKPWEVFNYLNSFISKVNQNADDKKFMSIDNFHKFILSVDSIDTELGDKGVYATEVMDKYDDSKAGINPFFVLSENKHYFGYIKALYKARNLIQSVSNVVGSTENFNVKIGDINTQEKYGSVEGYTFSLMVNSYLSSNEYTKNFKVGNDVYDLSNNIERNKFLLDMVGKTKDIQADPKLENNALIQGLITEKLRDNRTKEQFPILKTNNLMDLSESKRVALEQGMAEIKNLKGKYEEFHNALFIYSLILNKGGLGSKSFSSLFKVEGNQMNEDYLNHLNSLSTDDIIELGDNVNVRVMRLSNPSTLPTVNTTEYDSKLPVDESGNPIDIDTDGIEFYGMKRKSFEFINDNNFKLKSSYKNVLKKRGVEGDDKIVKSSQTGKIYMRNEAEGRYIVVTPVSFEHKGSQHSLTHRGIPFNLSNSTYDLDADVLSASGMEYGELAVTANIGGDFIYGRVYNYDSTKQKYKVKTVNNTFVYKTREELSRLNPDMLFYKNNFGKLTATQKVDIKSKGVDLKGIKPTVTSKPIKAGSLLGNTRSRVVDQGVGLISTNKDLTIAFNESKLVDFSTTDKPDYYVVENLGNASDFFVNNGIVKQSELNNNFKGVLAEGKVHNELGYIRNADNSKNIGVDSIVAKVLKDKTKILYSVSKYGGAAPDVSKIGKGVSVTAGTHRVVLDSFEGVSTEHLQLSNLSTLAYGVGKSKWVKKYNKALQPKDVKSIKHSDKVWLYGDTLLENKTPAVAIQEFKVIIDRAAQVGADILVGSESGVEEELKSYIMEKYPYYTYTNQGFKVGIVRESQDTRLYKDRSFNRFNSNNTLEVEGDTPGPFGIVTYGDSSFLSNSNRKPVAYNLISNVQEATSWRSKVSNQDVIDNALEIATEVKDSEWDNVRDEAVQKEELFIRKALAVGFLTTEDPSFVVNTIEDLDERIEEVQSNEEFQEIINKVFGSNGISNTLLLAMSRNRFITSNKLRESFPELFEHRTHPAFVMISSEGSAKMKSKEFQNIITSASISQGDLDFIGDDNTVPFSDMYHYLSTVGPDKVFTDKGQMLNNNVNKFLVGKGIDVIRDGDKYTVINNDSLIKYSAEAGNTNLKPNIKAQKDPVTYINEAKKILSSKQVSKSVMRKAFTDMFSKLDVNAKLMTSLEIASDPNYGEAYTELSGWVTPEGDLVINLDKATLDTPLHEYGGHIYMSYLKTNDIDLYQHIIAESLKNTDLRTKLSERYPELSKDDEALGEEIFSTMFGLMNQGKLLSEKNIGIFERISKLVSESNSIGDFFGKVFGSLFGIDSIDVSPDDSLASIIERVGDELVYGDGSIFNGMRAEHKSMLNDITNPVQTREDILFRLKSLNLIKEICI